MNRAVNHTGSQRISQGSETRNLWNYDTKQKISKSSVLQIHVKLFLLKVPENLQCYSQSHWPHGSQPFHDFAWYNS